MTPTVWGPWPYIQTRELLRLDHINVLADKGYHNREQLKQCHENGITTYVSPKAPATKDIGLYPNSEFIFDSGKDVYICPRGNQMHTKPLNARDAQSGIYVQRTKPTADILAGVNMQR